MEIHYYTKIIFIISNTTFYIFIHQFIFLSNFLIIFRFFRNNISDRFYKFKKFIKY